MSIFWVRDTCEIWLVCYGSKHMSPFLSDTTFVLTFMQNLKTTGCIYMDVLHIERLLYTIEDIPCVV